MTKIVVDIPNEVPYDVVVDDGALSQLGSLILTVDKKNQGSKKPRAVIITDTEVASRYLSLAKNSLEKSSFKVSVITVPAGEEAKSLECASEIWHAMLECHLDRDSVVVAFGGGVVGDLAGFSGSTFMRGLPIVQVPTTLLAMVDSSVGGKTAINLDTGKNLVGTFCQPLLVCADIATLSTLPDREWACGCAEIIKSAAIDSDEFFFYLTDNAKRLCARDAEVVREAIVHSVVFKASVVAQDKAETKGVRECLNYGHTLAHAIEKQAGYGVYSHGHAVAQGMRFAARLAANYYDISLDFALAQDDLLDQLNLPALDFRAEPEVLLELMKNDKKTRGGALRFVLVRDVGDWEVVSLDDDFVLKHLQAWQESLRCSKL